MVEIVGYKVPHDHMCTNHDPPKKWTCKFALTDNGCWNTNPERICQECYDEKYNTKPITVAAIICQLCGDTIYSRARHDFRPCSCGAIAIDGGFDYVKISGTKWTRRGLSIDVTRSDLYKDWSDSIDRFGLIKAQTI